MAPVVAYLARAFKSRTDFEPKLALKLVGAAAALGMLADALFHGAALGINVVGWHAVLLAMLLWVAVGGGVRLRPGQLAVLAASLGLSATAAWRGADTLLGLNLISAVSLLILGLAPLSGRSFIKADVLQFCLALVYSVASIAVAGYHVLGAVPWPNTSDSRSKEQALSLGWGLFVAVPLVLVFGGLFVSADAVFESKAKAALSVDVSAVVLHVLWLTGGAWFAAGCFWLACRVPSEEPPRVDIPEAFRLRTIAIAIVLGSLAALFAAFVAVQVHYLFGGTSVVLESIHLTYAQYARRGFFELVTASSLLLPVLLCINWARSRSKSSLLVFQALAVVLTVLLFVVMASALKRLDVYKDAYGLTELRLYAVSILVWLGLVFAWFAWTVMRARSDQFVAGAVLTAVVVIGGLSFVNPDDIIARTNTDGIRSARPFDAAHASELGPDAVPTLISRLDRLSGDDACVIANTLRSKWEQGSGDLRSWNWSRERARKAVIDHRAELEAACA